MSKKAYVYFVRCSDNTLYCGYTTDLERRVNAHNSGKGAKYTRSRLPVCLVYFEEFNSKEEAMSREWHIHHDRGFTRKKKEQMIKDFESNSCQPTELSLCGMLKSERIQNSASFQSIRNNHRGQ